MSTPKWFERAADELEADLASGALTYAQFLDGMRDLRAELEEYRSHRTQDDLS